MRRKTVLAPGLALLLSFFMIAGLVMPTKVQAEEPSATDISNKIVEIEAIPEKVAVQTVFVGTDLASLILPDTLSVRVQPDGSQPEEAAGVFQPLEVSWHSSPTYDSQLAGTYIFIPLMADEIALGQGVTLPQIVVMVEEKSESGEPASGDNSSNSLPDKVETVENQEIKPLVFGEVIEADGLLYRVLTDPEGGANGTVEVIENFLARQIEIENLTIPATVTNPDTGLSYTVVSIESFAFYYNDKLTGSLTLPASLTSIGRNAFTGCSGLSGNLTIPASVSSIYDSAFSGCSGFDGILTIQNGVASIGYSAFSECSGFTGSLTIPGSVDSIGQLAFAGCSGFNGSLTIQAGVTSIGSAAFSRCSGFTGELVIPEGVVSPGNSAFIDCSGFTGLVLPESLSEISDSAFWNCSGFEGDLVIPSGVTSIKEGAFGMCTGFTGSLILPDTLTQIDRVAFLECSGLTGALVIPAGVVSIGEMAFLNCSGFWDSLTLPEGLTSIGNGAFSDCVGLNGTVVLPQSLAYLGDYAFSGCERLFSIVFTNSEPPAVGEKYVYHYNIRVLYPDSWSSLPGYQPNLKLQYTLPNIPNIMLESQWVVAGETASFSVSLNSTKNTTYQWQEYVNGEWVDMPGQTSPVLNLPNTKVSLNYKYYCCKIQQGSNLAYSNWAELWVYASQHYGVSVENGTADWEYKTEGDTVILTADAPPSGWQFKEWNINPQVAFFDGYTAASQITSFVMPSQEVSAKAVYEPLASGTYSITILKEGCGTAGVTANAARPGDSVSLNARPEDGYIFTGWHVESGDITIQNNSFVMPAQNVVVVAKFAFDQRLENRSISDPATRVSVSGMLSPSSVLTVKPDKLHPEGRCAICDTIREKIKDAAVLAIQDISIEGYYEGKLTVSIPVEAKNNGKAVTILHCKESSLETLTGVVENGMVTFQVESLSPFALILQSEGGKGGNNSGTTSGAAPVSPQTGDNSNMILWIGVLALALLAGGFSFRRLMMQSKKQN